MMLVQTVYRFLACCILLSAVFACSDSGSSTALVVNEVVVKQSAASYQEVRHIVLRGTNQEIGRAIAQIANDHYQAQAMPFPSLDAKNRRNSYIRQYFPVLAERQKGVAGYYGWGDGDLHDTSALWYDMQSAACSSIFFPGTVTANGHSFVARNMDFYTVTMFALVDAKKQKINNLPPHCDPNNPDYEKYKELCTRGNRIFSRNYVMETYPQDGGYASMVLGTFDLLNGAYDGLNEYGLSISSLVDHDFPQGMTVWPDPPANLETQEGLSVFQMTRAVLEGARTVDEAKELISTLTAYFPMNGMHFLIGDRNGNSVIVEFYNNNGRLSPRFSFSSPNTPFIMTNHSVYLYPTIDKVLPKVDYTAPQDSFYRYLRLYDYLAASYFLKYTSDDGFYAMSLVQAFANKSSEGPSLDLPYRTLWTLVMDVGDLSMKIKFYTADDNNLKTPVFSDALTFRLQK